MLNARETPAAVEELVGEADVTTQAADFAEIRHVARERKAGVALKKISTLRVEIERERMGRGRKAVGTGNWELGKAGGIRGDKTNSDKCFLYSRLPWDIRSKKSRERS